MMNWSTRFPEPIPLPDGGQLRTLQDAGAYITKLVKQTHDSEPWQNAMHVLIQAADHGGPVEFARLGLMQALWPKDTPVYHSVDKGPKWRNRTKLVRDR
ncbi:hypothetical protein SAMN03159423_0487 [Bradyrhizobium sp. NFR13]|uniref:hypothetical protein n=1 Tax=Bradyrhizobium sp. NFR13 TaxID=1566285 RepID=UPI0008F1C040|nr:hypothetical protein [Bradyrhizobium sp. NFR13]SFM29763.1 hypothetical protein SAMN03159423_0487 [Bradyrhizobium sp. NFR13]